MLNGLKVQLGEEQIAYREFPLLNFVDYKRTDMRLTKHL